MANSYTLDNRKREPKAKCTMLVENDESIKTRVYECSSINTCYNHELNKYDNSKCSEYESCGSWKTDKYFEGCILNKFCGVDGQYTHGDQTTFKCPDK